MRAAQRVRLLSVCAVLLLGMSGSAAAQQPQSQDKPYFAPELILGVGGSADVTPSGAVLNVPVSGDLWSSEPEPTFGFGAKYMHPLHRYFVLGGQLSLQWWNTQALDDFNQDRSLLMDLAIVPQGRLPVTDGIELTLGLPVGLSLDFWGGDGFAFAVGPAAISADVSTGIGFNLALMFGARFALSDAIGLITELGYALHSVSHSVDVMVLGAAPSGDFDLSLGQPVLQVGVSF